MPCSWQLFTTSHIWRNRRFASGSLRRLRTRTYECRSPWNKHDNLQSIWYLNEWNKRRRQISPYECHLFMPSKCVRRMLVHTHSHAPYTTKTTNCSILCATDVRCVWKECVFGLPVTGRRINKFGWNLESLCVIDLRVDAHLAENERTIDLCTDYWQPKSRTKKNRKHRDENVEKYVEIEFVSISKIVK